MWKYTLMGVAALFAIIGTVAFLANRSGSIEAIEGQAVVDASDLDFGEAWRQPAFPWTVTLRNPWNQPIELQGIETSCDCTTALTDAVTLPPGESLPVELSLDLTAVEMEDDRGEFSVWLTFAFADGVPRLTSTLHGAVVPCPVEFDGSQLDLGAIISGVDAPFRRELDLACPPGTRITAAEIGQSPGVDLEVDGRNGGDGSIAVSVSEAAPIGPLSFVVDLRADDGTPRLLRLPFVGQVVPDAESIPGKVILGVRTVGEEFDEQITLQTRSGRWIESIELAEVPAGLTAEIVSPEDLPGTRAFVRVTGRVADVGSSRQLVRVRLVTLDGPAGTIDVPVEYHGLAGEVALREQ